MGPSSHRADAPSTLQNSDRGQGLHSTPCPSGRAAGGAHPGSSRGSRRGAPWAWCPRALSGRGLRRRPERESRVGSDPRVLLCGFWWRDSRSCSPPTNQGRQTTVDFKDMKVLLHKNHNTFSLLSGIRRRSCAVSCFKHAALPEGIFGQITGR